MDFRYELSLRMGVFEALSAHRGSHRRLLLDYLNRLQDDPFIPSDFTEKDGDGSYLEAKILGRFVIYYALDHAIKEVRVLKIIEADRA